MSNLRTRHLALIGLTGFAALGLLLAASAPLSAQGTIQAVVRPGGVPPWTKGIVPINPESYYHAIECGKQGGQDPPCVFWDTGLCKNPDFTLAFYTAYKMVAYEVWRAVSQKQSPPQPNYAEAQRTRVTIGVTPVRGSANAFADLRVLRGGRAVAPTNRSTLEGGGRYTFDYPAFAPTAATTLELAGKGRTHTCLLSANVLSQLR